VRQGGQAALANAGSFRRRARQLRHRGPFRQFAHRHLGDHRDRLEAFRVVFDIAIKRRSDGERGGAAKKERVAVGLGVRSDLAGERRAGARLST
jgi:hypothetical protein